MSFRICGICAMMPKRIQSPTSLDIHAQAFPEKILANHHLADEGFPSGHIDVGHDVHAAHQLQPTFIHKLLEIRGLFRIPVQKRFHQGSLVQRELVAGLALQRVEGLQNDGQAPCPDTLRAS